MRKWLIPLLICVFVCGVFFGIWINATHQHLVYQVNDFQRANLVVRKGDTISVTQQGNPKSPIQMQFNPGPGPCVEGATTAKCTISPKAPPASYFFTCIGGDYNCPDPAIQQASTNSHVGIVDTFRAAFSHSGKVLEAPVQYMPQSSVDAAPPLAQAGCPDGKTTVLVDPNGKDMTKITAPAGQTVFWISSRQFTISGSTPPGFCSNGSGIPDGTFTPQGGNSAETSCILKANGTTLSYNIQAQNSSGGACTTIPATIAASAGVAR